MCGFDAVGGRTFTDKLNVYGQGSTREGSPSQNPSTHAMIGPHSEPPSGRQSISVVHGRAGGGGGGVTPSGHPTASNKITALNAFIGESRVP